MVITTRKPVFIEGERRTVVLVSMMEFVPNCTDLTTHLHST